LFYFNLRSKLIFVIIIDGVESSRVVCEELSDLEDFNQPYAPGEYKID
jgi:hypothetical protein